MGGVHDNEVRRGAVRGARVTPVLVFAGSYVLFEALLIGAGMAGALSPLMALLARTTGSLVAWTGVPNTVLGPQIYLSNRILLINLDCTGLFVVAVFSALILAYPSGWGDRFLGLLIGIPALLAVNLVRLVAAAHVAVRWPDSFGLLHDFVFQVGMVLAALLLWAVWIGKSTNTTSPPPDDPGPTP